LQSFRQLDRIVIGPEMNEEETRLTAGHPIAPTICNAIQCGVGSAQRGCGPLTIKTFPMPVVRVKDGTDALGSQGPSAVVAAKRSGGRGWDRTSDLSDVNRTLSR
jgi:hypothetical protein